MDFDPLRPMTPLLFTPDARRMLALALLQAEEDERMMPAGWESRMLLGMLDDLGLLELVGGGYVATDFLRAQPWAAELRNQPFPD